jgi:hypothetical protein
VFGSREESVTCIACGDAVPRDEAREYDKHGDRWDRDGKRFEYMCKPCQGAICHRDRDDLGATLLAAGAGYADRTTFLRQFNDLIGDDARPTTEG